MKVLVIEDDPSLREIICRSLEKERYVTEEAPDFQTALENYKVKAAQINMETFETRIRQSEKAGNVDFWCVY